MVFQSELAQGLQLSALNLFGSENGRAGRAGIEEKDAVTLLAENGGRGYACGARTHNDDVGATIKRSLRGQKGLPY
jgi:hypothetical protein